MGYQSHPHGCVSWNELKFEPGADVPVTPSRVCELKYEHLIATCLLESGHTLTGVWVEIYFPFAILLAAVSHPHGCVSWNLLSQHA